MMMTILMTQMIPMFIVNVRPFEATLVTNVRLISFASVLRKPAHVHYALYYHYIRKCAWLRVNWTFGTHPIDR